MKLALILLVLLPLAYASTYLDDETIVKRSLIDVVIHHLQSLDLSKGCVKACEENVGGIEFCRIQTPQLSPEEHALEEHHWVKDNYQIIIFLMTIARMREFLKI
ncbi:hypothetical protein Ahia01_000229400 [Argonauta hians]